MEAKLQDAESRADRAEERVREVENNNLLLLDQTARQQGEINRLRAEVRRLGGTVE